MTNQKKKKTLNPYNNLALGTAKFGLTSTVGSAVVGQAGSQAGVNVTGVQSGLQTAVGFAPLGVTLGAGNILLKQVKTLSPKKKRK